MDAAIAELNNLKNVETVAEELVRLADTDTHFKSDNKIAASALSTPYNLVKELSKYDPKSPANGCDLSETYAGRKILTTGVNLGKPKGAPDASGKYR